MENLRNIEPARTPQLLRGGCYADPPGILCNSGYGDTHEYAECEYSPLTALEALISFHEVISCCMIS